MIMFDFRLEDEEVLSHFASFLKTLSLRLTQDTVQQFFLRGPRRKSRAQPQPPPASGEDDDETADSTTTRQPAEAVASETVAGGGRREAGSDLGNGASSAGGEAGSSTPKTAAPRDGAGGGAGGQRKGHNGSEGGAAEEEEEGSSFPLYTRALEYICHGDFHVRIAALTVVLNIYNQRDPLVRAYLNSPAARSASLPDRLVGALRSQCLVLADSAMAAGVGGGGEGAGGRGGGAGGAPAAAAAAAAAVDPTICRDSIAGLQDQVFYLEDVFASGQRELNAELCESLLGRLVRPMLLGDWLSGRSGAMFPQVALCALAQLFIVVTHPPLVRLLVLETLGSETAQGVGPGGAAAAAAAAAEAAPPSSTAEVDKNGAAAGDKERAGPGAGRSPPLLALLQGDREELCLGALVVLQALAQNQVVRTDLGLTQDAADEPAQDHEGQSDAAAAAGTGAADGQPNGGCAEEGQQTAAGEGEGGAASSAARAAAAAAAADPSARPLGMEMLDAAVDALCCMLAPSTATQAVGEKGARRSGEETAGAVTVGRAAGAKEGAPSSALKGEGAGRVVPPEGGREEAAGSERGHESVIPVPPTPLFPRPRRHHLVLRLCGKVLASLAPPPPPLPLPAGAPMAWPLRPPHPPEKKRLRFRNREVLPRRGTRETRRGPQRACL
ncbi:unnamed protein product [Ectocarpus fasciculatus]